MKRLLEIARPSNQFLAFATFLFSVLGWYADECSAEEKPQFDRSRFHHIQVIDRETGQGVPLVELRTVNDIRCLTDSAGNIAFCEADLMDEEVFFHVFAHGYEMPKDGFGYRGVRIRTTSGGKTVIKVKRKNLASRLYRITGTGIYRDTRLLGLEPPVDIPEMNARVLGSDSVVNAVYQNRLYWFWGDTNQAAYPLGNFQVTGATSDLPNKIDPSKGFRLNYFKQPSGFAKSMAPIPGPGPTWIFGLFVSPDQQGHHRLVAKYEKIKPPLSAYQRGLVVYDDAKEQFNKLVEFDMTAPLYPHGQAVLHKTDDKNYVYFGRPFPLVRVINQFETIQSPRNYEAYTFFKTGERLPEGKVPQKNASVEQLLDRNREGKLIYKWRKNTQPLSPKLEQTLVNRGILDSKETITLLQPANNSATSKQVVLSSGSVAWNKFRNKWIMIAVEVGGTSMLGEIWFAEANKLEGPWENLTKIVSHEQYSFYNPRHHPYFDRKKGRKIYFEGTYTKMFSGSKVGTPRYDYNQIMYELDLDLLKTDSKSRSDQ